MSKEYLGVDAVNDLFDIIDENYISREDFEKKEKEIASAVYVGSVLISRCLLKLVEAIENVKGAEGGDDSNVTTDEEVDEMLDDIFGQ